MPNEPQRPRRPGWRSAGQPSASARPKHAWQRDSGARSEAPHAVWSTRAKLGLVALGFMALVCGIVGLLYLIRRQIPPQVEIALAANVANLPAPLAAYDKPTEEAFLQIHLGDNTTAHSTPLIAADPATFDAWLERCRSSFKQKAAQKVVLFLALPGGADADGPYLITEGADPGNTKHRLYLTTLLNQLEQLDAKTHKLVLLDPVQTTNHAPFGIIHNAFVQQLRGMKDQIEKVPNLVILCACAEDQRSWVSDEWGQSVFAHYVLEGLKGAAKGSGGRIYPGALHQYVRAHVSQWTRDNRDAQQTPILLPESRHDSSMELSFEDPAYQEPKVQPNTTAEATFKDQLSKKWEFVYASHGESAHAPWVHAPRLWKEFLDRLLRAEAVSRAGTAPDLAALERLQHEIERSREETPTSFGNTLAGARSLPHQLAAETRDDLTKRFNEAWANSAEAKAIGALFKASGLPAQMHGLSLLVDRAMKDPARNLKRAARAVRAVEDGGAVRPAEAHFLVMLDEHRTRSKDDGVPWEPADWNVVQRALQVRLLAEEAALCKGLTDPLPAYTEEVYRWIQPAVEKADADRQFGEDDLLAAREKEAQKLLLSAEKTYTQAIADAKCIRQALWARDTVLAQLPYYGQWVARQHVTRFNRDLVDNRMNAVVDLWQQLHELDDLLISGRESPGKLQIRALALSDKFAKLKTEFDNEYKSFLPIAQDFQPGRWHEIQAVLAVPFIKPSERLVLLEKSLKISFNLAINFPFKPEQADEGHAAVDAVALLDESVRQARIAGAEIGQKRLEASGDPVKPNRDEPSSLSRAGAAIGRQWLKQRDQVRVQAAAGRKELTLENVRTTLRDAGNAARHLDGAALSTLDVLDPLRDSLRVQRHDLLCWLAQRALGDYWFSDNDRPYFQEAGDRYLLDGATALAGATEKMADNQSDPRLTVLDDLKKKLKEDGRFIAKWHVAGDQYESKPVGLHLTDEKKYKRDYQILVPKTAPKGTMAYGFQRTGILAPKSGAEEKGWQAVSLDGTLRPQLISTLLEPARPKDFNPLKSKPEGGHVLRAYFRGRRFDVETPVTVHLMPDLVMAHNPHFKGGVRVQSSRDNYQVRNVAIAIVLDASGSMCSPISLEGGIPFDPKKPLQRRFDKAVRALRQALQELPPDVSVSLRVFSGVGNEEPKDRPLWPAKRWDEEELKTVGMKVDELHNLVPKYQTPLIQSMIKAKGDFPPGFSGTKYMLVLTDGGDSTYQKDDERLKKDLLGAFSGTHISLNVIGFEANDLSPDEARNAKLLRDLVKSKDLGGTYQDAEAKSLTGILKESLRLNFVVNNPRTGQELPQRPGITRSDAQENTQWVALPPPALYHVRPYFGAGRSSEGVDVLIGPGDYLAINLAAGDNGFLFQRDIWARRYAKVEKRYQESGEWASALPLLKRTTTSSLEGMMTLESTRDGAFRAGGKDEMRQDRPRMLIMEVKPVGEAAQGFRPVRVANLDDYAAPAWRLDVQNWPSTDNITQARVAAWWSDIGESNPKYAALLRFGANFDPDAVNRKFKDVPSGFLADEVVLESLGIEGPNGKEELVVRLRYPPNRPFMVRLVGRNGGDLYAGAASEHAFYSPDQAGKYVGRFAGWNEDRPQWWKDKDLALELIDVNAFKAEAERGKKYVSFELRTDDTQTNWPQKIEPSYRIGGQ